MSVCLVCLSVCLSACLSVSLHVGLIVSAQGIEDAQGNMDFKVAGTREGITSLQVLDYYIL